MNNDLPLDTMGEGNSRISLPVAFIRQLNSASSIKAVLRYTARWLPNIIEADRASICLAQFSSSIAQKKNSATPITQLQVFTFVGREAIPQDTLISIKGTQVGRAYQDQTPVRCDDCSQSRAHDCQMLYRAGIHSCLSAPLRQNGACFGTLNIGHSCKGFYTNENLIILQCLADWVTTYLLNQKRLHPQEECSFTDPVTGVANRRHYFDQGTQLYGRWRHGKYPYTLAIFDIDGFNTIYHNHGEEAGNKVLQDLCRHMLKHIRSDDTLARIGDQEFALLLPDTQSEAAEQVVQRNQRSIANTPLEHQGERFSVTIRVGLSQVHTNDSSFDETMLRAHSALHHAKSRSNKCARVSPSPLM